MGMTIALAAANVIAFILLSLGGRTEDGYYMYLMGASYTPAIIYDGEWYRLFTSMFMHFGLEHLLNNMLSLLVLGKYIEPLVGKIRFLVIYILSGLAGNVLSFLVEVYTEDYAVSAGASGATFGLTGALLSLVLMNHGRIGTITKQSVLLMIAISLYSGFTSSGVDNLAHAGGLIAGVFFTGILCWNLYGKRRTDTEY